MDTTPVNGSHKPHRDFVLWCEGCNKPTTHTFAEKVPVGIRMLDVMYECVRCSSRRQYGREEGSFNELLDLKTKVKP